MASERAPSAAWRVHDERADRERTRPIEISSLIVGDTAVARIRGELDVSTAPNLRTWANGAFAHGARNLVIDCADTSFLDSAGLRVLLELYDHAHRECGTLTVRHCSSAVRRVIEATGLAQHLGVEPPR